MELVESPDGRRIHVIHESYKFSRNVRDPNRESCTWVCTTRGCQASILIDINTTKILRGEPSHNHEPPKIEDISVTRKKKKKVRKKKKIASILPEDNDFVKIFSDKDIQLVRNNMLMDESVTRIKVETERMSEGMYDSLNVTIPSHEEVFQIDHNGRSSVCFTTTSNLALLCDSDSILIDRTFPRCSGYIHQLITIYCPKSYQPLAHILLPEEYCSFLEMFQKLVVHCTDLGMRFEPRIIRSNLDAEDFTIMERIYPLCIIGEEKSGATESWWMKIQDLGLTEEFLDMNSNVAKWLRWTFPMFYLNQSDVADSFMEHLKSKTSQMEIMNMYAYYLIDSDISPRSSQDSEPSFLKQSLNQ